MSEKKIGYLLVAPSLLLIFVIAIWPVMQSFYFSLFDLKLNDPTRSEVHLSHNIDLDRYLNNYPFLVGAIDSEMKTSSEKNQLQEVKTELEDMDKKLQNDSALKEKYQSVNDKLMNFEQVGNKESIAKIDNSIAEDFGKTGESINKKLKSISKETKLTQEKKILGLAAGYKEVVQQPNFVGFQHYKDDLTNSRMWKAMGNTLTFTVVSVVLEFVIGLAIALLINKAFVGRGLIRASILIPWAIPTAVSAMMWKFLYDGQNGIIAKLFSSIGIVDKMENLLVTDTGAMFSVIFADVWKTTPYMSLLLLAGLQTIPSSLYEAAAIDGAGKWRQFVSITLPLLKSSILVALLFRTLDAFRVFDLVYVLTGGGPANSTETISILAYKVMFSQTNFGNGSALSVIVFICVAVISMIYIKFLGKDLLGEGSGR
ncbi:ABC transporter permease subunit [Peribacillus sp. B-H-3]|uniref:ABC transporter permease subunit n=1 Tax=Peribacillus sp. B-H-3 TaxID=3400420 RepID=UPI003B02DCE6